MWFCHWSGNLATAENFGVEHSVSIHAVLCPFFQYVVCRLSFLFWLWNNICSSSFILSGLQHFFLLWLFDEAMTCIFGRFLVVFLVDFVLWKAFMCWNFQLQIQKGICVANIQAYSESCQPCVPKKLSALNTLKWRWKPMFFCTCLDPNTVSLLVQLIPWS